MIKLNNTIINQNQFPDGSLRILDFPYQVIKENNNIVWKYESDAELFTLICVVKQIRSLFYVDGKPKSLNLVLPYIPHARMDRVKDDKVEVFTLKFFCEIINSLEFDNVFALDPHSNVSLALINHIRTYDVEQFITWAIDDIEGKDIDGGEKYAGKTVIYFPDEGAMKRYRDLDIFTGRTLLYGKKVRDWKTGQIKGLTIHYESGEEVLSGNGLGLPLKEQVILMIDDIISYGGTLAYSADALKDLGASAIYAYASHTENSVLDEEKGTLLKRLNDGTVDELFTTNSIYKYQHPRVTVYEGF